MLLSWNDDPASPRIITNVVMNFPASVWSFLFLLYVAQLEREEWKRSGVRCAVLCQANGILGGQQQAYGSVKSTILSVSTFLFFLQKGRLKMNPTFCFFVSLILSWCESRNSVSLILTHTLWCHNEHDVLRWILLNWHVIIGEMSGRETTWLALGFQQ